MFNQKRIEEIRKNIQISTILSDHEKSDWLNLLDLMNDKQLGELEEILGVMPSIPAIQKVATPVQQPTPPQQRPHVEQDVVAPVKMPPLSHIANIPTDVTMTHSVPSIPSSAPAPAPAPAFSKPTFVKQELVKPQPLKSAQSTPAKPQPAQPVVSKPSVVPKPVPPSSLKKLAIQNASEIQAFEVSTLRQYELQSIVDAMRTTIQGIGYFQVLQHLEASPLYRSYIETGKFMLGHGGAKVVDPETTLTQTEFEFITDLLRHMRFNTW